MKKEPVTVAASRTTLDHLLGRHVCSVSKTRAFKCPLGFYLWLPFGLPDTQKLLREVSEAQRFGFKFVLRLAASAPAAGSSQPDSEVFAYEKNLPSLPLKWHLTGVPSTRNWSSKYLPTGAMLVEGRVGAF